MHDCKPISMPLDVNVKFSAMANDMTQKEYKMMLEVPFREAMGKLMFVMIATILDLDMVVGIVSQFIHKLQMDH